MEKQKRFKIVDTIGNFGAAEKHIVFSADFERFLKSTYGRVDLLKVDPEQIIKKYNLKGFVFGNYVTQEERYHFVYKIGRQLEVLARLKGDNNLGKGVLIIAFGSKGIAKSAAHYNADEQLINLNRGRKGNYKDVLQGENSFIHEYGHFLDFLQGQKDSLIGHKNKGVNFASESTNFKGSAISLSFSSLVDKVEQNESYMKGLEGRSNTKYLKSRIEIFARLFETVITYGVTTRWKKEEAVFSVNKYGADLYIKKDEAISYFTNCISIIKGEALKPNKKAAPKKEVSKMFKIPAKQFKQGHSFYYYDTSLKKWFFIDSEKELTELKNIYTLKLINEYINKNSIDISQLANKKKPVKKKAAIKKTEKDSFYISFLNKDKNFKEDKKIFTDYENAKKWGKSNLDNFNLDMIKSESQTTLFDKKA